MTAPRAVAALHTVPNAIQRAAADTPARVSSSCPRCAADFVCAANAALCWCDTLAVLDITACPEALLGKGCLCEACLSALISESAKQAAAA